MLKFDFSSASDGSEDEAVATRSRFSIHRKAQPPANDEDIAPIDTPQLPTSFAPDVIPGEESDDSGPRTDGSSWRATRGAASRNTLRIRPPVGPTPRGTGRLRAHRRPAAPECPQAAHPEPSPLAILVPSPDPEAAHECQLLSDLSQTFSCVVKKTQTLKGRRRTFELSSACGSQFKAKMKCGTDILAIARGDSVHLSQGDLDAVLLIARDRRNFSLRVAQVSGRELLTVQSQATARSPQVVAFVYLPSQPTPCIMNGRVKGTAISFMTQASREFARVTGIGTKRLTIIADTALDGLKLFGLSISLFLLTWRRR